MMDGLSGLSGIAGYQQQINADAQASPEQRNGNVADARHSIVGEQAAPYPWQSKATQAAAMHGPYGPENQLLDDTFWFWEPAGMPDQNPWMDNTPSRRAAPWPKGINSGVVPSGDPDETSRNLLLSMEIHGTNMGASRGIQHMLDPQNDDWQDFAENDPGNTDQLPLDKRAISSGFMWGTRDRLHSMARQNEFGFDTAHKHRRWAAGGIPGNTMWLRPGGRPMMKSLPGPARPAIGPDSPFSNQNLGQAFDPNGAVLQNVPTEYVPPPQPNLAAAMQATGNEAPVEWW
jgi:hypothetical protein